MPEKDPNRYATTDGKPPHPEYGGDNSPAPQPINPATGQHRAYWVLSEAERAKGFVRPLRSAYKHTGQKPTGELRDLTFEERKQYEREGYVKFETYPPERGPLVGRYWTEAQLKGGCGTVTSMGLAIAETYAREPKFYGSTFCTGCGKHFPVADFVWIGQDGRATDEPVGS